MALQIREILIPPMTRTDRASRTLQFPTGAEVLGVFQPAGNSPYLIARGDPAQPLVPRNFVAVRAGIDLTPAEEVAAYVGSFMSYRTEQGNEVYHLLAL
jgi:hypothetical protein